MISSFFFRSLDENRDILWCCSGCIWFLSKFELLLKYWIDKFWLLLPIFDFGLILNPTTTSYPMIFLGRRRLWNENPPKQKGSEQISKYTSMRTDLGNTYFFMKPSFLKIIERYWEFFFMPITETRGTILARAPFLRSDFIASISMIWVIYICTFKYFLCPRSYSE